MKKRHRERQAEASQQVLMEPETGYEAGEPSDASQDGPRGGPPWKARTVNGYALDVTVSALQKCVRRGREREALFWAHELYTSNYANYFWRRMLIIAHEECASDPSVALFVGQACANAMFASQNGKGRVEGLIEAHAVLVACRATKSREACDAAMAVNAAKKAGWRIQPHDAAFDKHTAHGRQLGRDRTHFRDHGRLVAGVLGRNDYEALNWNQIQEYLKRPEEKGGEPDVKVPSVKRTGTE